MVGCSSGKKRKWGRRYAAWAACRPGRRASPLGLRSSSPISRSRQSPLRRLPFSRGAVALALVAYAVRRLRVAEVQRVPALGHRHDLVDLEAHGMARRQRVVDRTAAQSARLAHRPPPRASPSLARCLASGCRFGAPASRCRDLARTAAPTGSRLPCAATPAPPHQARSSWDGLPGGCSRWDGRICRTEAPSLSPVLSGRVVRSRSNTSGS